MMVLGSTAPQVEGVSPGWSGSELQEDAVCLRTYLIDPWEVWGVCSLQPQMAIVVSDFCSHSVIDGELCLWTTHMQSWESIREKGRYENVGQLLVINQWCRRSTKVSVAHRVALAKVVCTTEIGKGGGSPSAPWRANLSCWNLHVMRARWWNVYRYFPMIPRKSFMISNKSGLFSLELLISS